MNFKALRLTCLAFFAEFVLVSLMLFGPISATIVLLVLLFTPYFWITVIYGVFFFLTRNEYKNRRLKQKWFCDSSLWKYLKYYHPMRLYKVSEKVFDAKKNYLFVSHPHGFWCKGVGMTTAWNIFDWDAHFPGLQPMLANLKLLFYLPVVREILWFTGNIEVGENSVMRYLNDPKGGNAVAIVPGGTREMIYMYPNTYQLAIKNRKGFIRLALKSGASLVPMISFGENDLAYTYVSKKGTLIRKIDELVKRVTGIGLKLMIGRGIFLPFGVFSIRNPINVVVGEPMDVTKSENPTEKEIDELHKLYKSKLYELFESEKHKYIKNAEKVHINFVD